MENIPMGMKRKLAIAARSPSVVRSPRLAAIGVATSAKANLNVQDTLTFSIVLDTRLTVGVDVEPMRIDYDKYHDNSFKK